MNRVLGPCGATAFALVMACAGAGAQGPPAVTAQGVDTTLSREATAEVFCTDTAPRQGGVRINWRSSPSLLRQQPGIELTVYKNGFARGLVTAIDLQQERPRPTLAPQAAEIQNVSRALSGLTVLRRPIPRDSGTMALEILGLQPGLTYFWRAASGRGISAQFAPPLRFTAPTCPSDERDQRQPG